MRRGAARVWARAQELIAKATEIHVIGYSFAGIDRGPVLDMLERLASHKKKTEWRRRDVLEVDLRPHGKRKYFRPRMPLKRGGNVLALDEPTNDLDLGTLRLLEEALVAFDGSVVVVSHDRYFLNRVCASILAFEGDGVVRYSIGDYDYFLEKRAERLASTAAPPTTASSATGSERMITAQRPRKLKWSERQELETIENKILAAEEDLVRLEAQFADPDFYTKHGQYWQMFDAKLQTARENISQLYSRWEELERIRAER